MSGGRLSTEPGTTQEKTPSEKAVRYKLQACQITPGAKKTKNIGDFFSIVMRRVMHSGGRNVEPFVIFYLYEAMTSWLPGNNVKDNTKVSSWEEKLVSVEEVEVVFIFVVKETVQWIGCLGKKKCLS